MSKIPDLGKNLCQLPEILTQYENELDDVESHIGIKNKTLERANRDQTWQSYYDQRRIELKTILDYIENNQIKRIRGKLFQKYTENFQQELSDRAKDKYIDNEQAYLEMYEIFLEVKEVYNKYQSVVDTFTSRGYALNNITKARVAEVHDVTL